MLELKNCNVFLDEDSLGELGAMLDADKHHSILLVTGSASYEASGARLLLAPLLEGREVTRVFDFQTNPQKSDLCRI